jgi:hypothetical protein
MNDNKRTCVYTSTYNLSLSIYIERCLGQTNKFRNKIKLEFPARQVNMDLSCVIATAIFPHKFL